MTIDVAYDEFSKRFILIAKEFNREVKMVLTPGETRRLLKKILMFQKFLS